ncbi:hypothetical protein GGF50DRAFT_113626 [Schizophyllum commune]
MSLRLNTYGLSVDELLERAASVANLAMLRTYAEPSSIQIAAIEVYTPLLESDLESLHPSDISSRDRIQAQLDIHRSILAPIRRLPKELLIEIFFTAAYDSSLHTLLVAATISRVSTVWRHIAHGLTELWTKIVVRSMDDFDRYCELFLPLTRGNLPDLRCDDREILWDLWDRIEAYASRWRSLALEGRLTTLCDLKVLYMEKLERLVIDAYDAPTSSELSVLDFVVAPRLRHIAFTIDALQSARQLHVPVSRSLTSLVLTSVASFPVTIALPLLQTCADTLQILTIKIRRLPDGADESYPTSASATFVMQALTHLSLVDPACALLNHITAPLTRELVLCTVPAYGTRSLLGFLLRGKPSRNLRILRVYDAQEQDPSAWMPCLRLMDNLRALHFDDLLSNKDFLEQMIKREGRPPLLPALEGIALWRVFWGNLELHNAITDMCTSRVQETTWHGRQAWRLIEWLDSSWKMNHPEA